MEIENEVKKEKFFKVKPLKNFIIKQNNIYIELIEGVEADVPERFKENLITENVIKNKKKGDQINE